MVTRNASSRLCRSLLGRAFLRLIFLEYSLWVPAIVYSSVAVLGTVIPPEPIHQVPRPSRWLRLINMDLSVEPILLDYIERVRNQSVSSESVNGFPPVMIFKYLCP